ncbi:unnamed protein product [Cuscuta campestris]|uniref:Uncharacterized protein n=1 Tax=Cuscuta campestris TaxID=132261 RepID=A0A484N760_9ASTE|nr:unnamed protein product [Cuscuta campestris]
MPREYVSVPGHAKTAHDFMLVNEEVHAESCLLAGAWRCFQQNGNFNASTKKQKGNFTMVHAESCLLAGAWRCFQQNGNFNASTDEQNGNFTMCLRPRDIKIPLNRLYLPCHMPHTMVGLHS